MRTVGAFEAKNTFGSLLDLVERGEEITITRHGKAVAKLVAPAAQPGSAQAIEAVARIKDMRKGVKLGGLSFKELINEGRR